MKKIIFAAILTVFGTVSSAQTTGRYYPVAPCRAIDHAPFSGQFIMSPGDTCFVPDDTLAIIIHVTVVNPDNPGHMTIFQPEYTRPPFPQVVKVPLLSQLNWLTGQTINGMTIVPYDYNNPNGLYFVPVEGVSGQVVVDIIGYFVQ